MKRIIISVVICLSLFAFAGEREYLWPEGKMPHPQTNQIAAMTDVAGAKGFVADEWRKPFVEWFEPPAKPVRGCMILISGGGYDCCCDVGLIADWKKKFTELGFQCVNLVYRTGRPKNLPFYQSAWEDGQRAVRIVRRAAAKRGFDPEQIGTISMSAGSHLATLLSVSSQTSAYERVDELDDTPCHINFAITGAIAYALKDGLGVPNMREGDSPDLVLDDVFAFDGKSAPMCMLHGGRDPYSPFASTHVYRRLREKGVPAELHLFADREHGFWGWNPGKGNSTAYDNWFDRVTEFLRQLGKLGPLEPEVELMKRYATDDARAEYVKEDVWPKGKTPNFFEGHNVPYLEWHIPSNLTTKAIQIIYSGGAYWGNDPDDFEVAPARRFLNERGMAVVTMKYRCPNEYRAFKHVAPWQDLQRTIRIVRSEAKSRGLDPDRIGIMGSSAGGHLTLMGATSSRHRSYLPIDEIDSLSCNVQWAVAIYPAYALTDGLDIENTTRGNDPSLRLAPEFSFDPDTCPIVFIHGDADGWSAMNSVRCWEQLHRMGIQGELHTLVGRTHCFQRSAAPGTGSYTWLGRIWEFMNHKHFNR